MIKLQDFARECGVTDRAIQKHLKTYADELDGLFQRRGPNGTWLTDEACEILRSKMKQLPPAVFEPDPRVGQLEQDLEEVKAAAKDLFDQNRKKDETIATLVKQNEEYRLQVASVARLEADNKEAIQRAAEAVKAAQESRRRLSDAHEGFEKELLKKNMQIDELKRMVMDQYEADVAAFEKLTKFQRWISGAKRPMPPVFNEEDSE